MLAMRERRTPAQLTSRKEVVSRIKNMLIIPRYLVIFAPAMKERGVILTTGTVELMPEEPERRDCPSVNGLGLSNEMATSGRREEGKKEDRQRITTQYMDSCIGSSNRFKPSSWFPHSLVTTFSCP